MTYCQPQRMYLQRTPHTRRYPQAPSDQQSTWYTRLHLVRRPSLPHTSLLPYSHCTRTQLDIRHTSYCSTALVLLSRTPRTGTFAQRDIRDRLSLSVQHMCIDRAGMLPSASSSRGPMTPLVLPIPTRQTGTLLEQHTHHRYWCRTSSCLRRTPRRHDLKSTSLPTFGPAPRDKCSKRCNRWLTLRRRQNSCHRDTLYMKHCAFRTSNPRHT